MANVVFPLKATRQKTWGPFKNLVFCVLCKTLYKNSHKVYKWDKVKIIAAIAPGITLTVGVMVALNGG